ncbi:MAG: hypothetical protein OHK0029_34970 [Armatimonadaceae bacterium]
MPSSRRGNARAASLTLSSAQRTFLQTARIWWSEGERSLDYLAELARQEAALSQLQTPLQSLRAASSPEGKTVAPILSAVRRLTGNRALNRTLETPEFATGVRDLLFSPEPLANRLSRFLQTHHIGPLIASHLLYAAYPDRYPPLRPLFSPLLHWTAPQRAQAKEITAEIYGEEGDEPDRTATGLLTEFVLYETVRREVGVSSFTELDRILMHAPEMPRANARNRRNSPKVRESGSAYSSKAIQPAEDDTESGFSEELLLDWIEGYIEAQGFSFPPLVVRNYYLSLKAKPYVLLTGLSGTGKTRLTRLLADAITGNSSGNTSTAPNSQYLLIPVRPDWSESTPLLGYFNLLTDQYVSTPFLQFVRHAGQPENRERPFFVCLDEANLARPEHYMAEILSAMETPERQIPLFLTTTLTLPGNLFLSGSVNMDEATHPFSRKVLDRANIIEFTEVQLDRGLPVRSRSALSENPFAAVPSERQRTFLSAQVRSLPEAWQRLQSIHPAYPEQIVARLSEWNTRLQPRGLHFGYRVRDEILRYLAGAFTSAGVGLLHPESAENIKIALDLQIIQKVLPRLSGTADSLNRFLTDLADQAENEGLERTAAKIRRIRERSEADGIVSFYEL